MSTDQNPPASRAEGTSSRPARNHARTLTILLFLVGLGGYGTAALVDRSHASTAVMDQKVLGQQDPVAATAALRARAEPVKRAFDRYAAASLAVAAARADVNRQFNEVVRSAAPGSQDAAATKARMTQGIAAYGVAVERERAAKNVYAGQLALLLAEVHK